ncbi:unannotated protein [freshwater metagenome]|uniref:Unannotated protein n=1 Tax=freshwater metagenome TaxID=449393 RepID=A0A6J5ZR96_9ZZZZ
MSRIVFFGRLSHSQVVDCTKQSVKRKRVFKIPVAILNAFSATNEQMWSIGHAFHAAGYDYICQP